jgi:hypothetical protein
MLTLTIGKRHRIAVSSIAEASAIYCQLRDEADEGSSTWPNGRVGDFYISYNGKVWTQPPKDWQISCTPIYNPYA